MLRKHRKQMTPAEIHAVEARVKRVPAWVSQPYYAVRARERNVSRLEVYRAIAFGQAIEAKDDDRVLMRGSDGVCVVVEIPTRKIVTVWYNSPDDQHWTLDLSQYRWNVNLVTWVN